jgi:hypothetical protein
MPGEFGGVLPTVGQQIGLAQPGVPERMFDHLSHRRGLLDSLLEQWQGLGRPPRQHIRIAQMRGAPGELVRHVHDLVEQNAPFEHGDGPVQVPFTEV